MPEELTANDVISRVRWLEQDQLLREMRNRARSRHDLISMYATSDIPPHMTRGDAVATPSPALIALLNSILADMASYPTTTTVIPEGKTSVDFNENADEVEKAYAIIRSRLDEGGQNSSDRRWHQGGTGWVVEIIHCAAAGETFDNGLPWRKEIPDPLTCFFPMEGGPRRPSIMGRRYVMQFADAKARYDGQKRTKYAGQELGITKDGIVGWAPISEDMPVEASDVGSFTAPRVGLPGYSTSIEIMELYTPDKVYHVALHGTLSGQGALAGDGLGGVDGMLGQMVYEADTMTGGIPVVVVPGHVTPLRNPVERFQPAILPAMQCVLMIQLIRDMMMTRAFNWRPDFLVEQSPEMVMALRDAGALSEPTNLQLEQGGPNIINVNGKPMLWTMPADDTLQLLLQSWTVELNGYINTATSVTTAEVAKQSTLGGIQLAIGVRKRQQGPWLAHGDWADAEELKMVRASMLLYKKDVPLYSRGGERYHKGSLSPNTSVTLTAKMVDFPHEIVVTTASLTEEERQMMVEAWAQRRALGLATLEQGLEAAGEQDIEQAIEDLAVDLMEAHNTSAWTQIGDAELADYLRTSGGIIVTIGGNAGGAQLPPGQTQPAPPGPGGQNRIPATATVAGGSLGAQAQP